MLCVNWLTHQGKNCGGELNKYKRPNHFFLSLNVEPTVFHYFIIFNINVEPVFHNYSLLFSISLAKIWCIKL